MDVKLSATDKTFKILERWKEVHTSNPEIPYPKKAIELKDWYEIGEHLEKIKLEYGTDLTNYILD